MKDLTGTYVIIRSDRAGVFAGVLIGQSSDIVVLNNCRRIWYWDGAASLSQMAVSGVSKPKDCKFSVPTTEHRILGVIEIIPCTPEAEANIKAVPEWLA